MYKKHRSINTQHNIRKHLAFTVSMQALSSGIPLTRPNISRTAEQPLASTELPSQTLGLGCFQISHVFFYQFFVYYLQFLTWTNSLPIPNFSEPVWPSILTFLPQNGGVVTSNTHISNKFEVSMTSRSGFKGRNGIVRLTVPFRITGHPPPPLEWGQHV